MSCNWPRVQISEVCELIVDCVNKTAPRVDYKTPFKMIRTPNVKGGKISLNDCRFVEEDTYEKWTRRAKVLRDDVLLTREAPMGEVGIVDFDETVFLGQRIMQYRVDRSKLDPHFLLYSFLSSDLQHQFSMHEGSGSVVSHIRVPDCSKFELNLPPLDVQKEIAGVLKKLDRKISVNQQTNQTLEQMAQAIFKSWFVDFDPVKAKMNGEQPEGMDAATASLFPEKLVESELGLIPEGWEIKPFSEWVKITKGKNITKKTIVDGDVPVVAGGLKPAYFHNAHNVDGPAITISASGANAGYVNLYFENIWASDCSYISQSTTPMFFLQYVALRYNQKKIFDMQTGAAQPHIYPRDFERLMIVVPNEELCRKLECVFVSFFGTVANNKQQNIELAALRDTLLPKLLSGEIELGQAQELAEVD
ncbi:restriction endonuclease subunit S [Vibrio fujianensis]|uniref:restriction endonuclease subunit S n=1 Tax=Vibrio fujianensis TaxID=1974215 RepID=UPI000C168CA1|nr:restriction endonuclease subunit S [Vibrio fujianensis]